MPLRVHFYRISFEEHCDLFKSLLDSDIQLSEGEQIPEPADYEILVYPTPNKDWMEASSNLKAVVIPWAGIPVKTREVMANYPHISLHNLHHNNYNTAELGLALLLAAAKRLIPMDQALRKNDWSPRYLPTKAILLREKSALILGFGEIGQALGEYCLALGMQVRAIKKHPANYKGELPIEIYSTDKLHHLLPKTDVLIVALPLTDETENLINEDEINMMPQGGILVNIGRGPIVNQHALYQSLKNGHLRAAGSDVWYNYPPSKAEVSNTPPADVPLGECENFVLSPHRGGMVEEVEIQRVHALAKILNAASQGLPIPNKVDLQAGY
jgi:phosphoglycerate dehydrogenase-like enzyme